MSRSLTSLLLVAALAAGCTTSTHTRTIHGDAVPARTTRPTHAWRVVPPGVDSATLGYVVQFEAEEAGSGGFWSVRNGYHQELGMVDALGRAWRFEPHAEARLLGSGTVAEGVGRILDTAHGVRLIDVSIETLRTGAPR